MEIDTWERSKGNLGHIKVIEIFKLKHVIVLKKKKTFF